jgi:hypothetical protein
VASTDRTEWSAVFAACAELRRRGYQVAVFLGNAPKYDALCIGENSRVEFPVQIKGFGWLPPQGDKVAGGWIPIHDLRTASADDVIIIVHVPVAQSNSRCLPPFRFFIARRGDLAKSQPKVTVNPKTGKPYAPFPDGVSYRAFKCFENRWDLLPAP